MSDLSTFKSEFSFKAKALRAFWQLVWILLFFPSPRPCFAWRRFLLRLFGARIGKGARIYSSAKIFYPPHLTMKNYSILGPGVDCYCVDIIVIGEHAMISQYTYLCTGSHDYTLSHMPLITQPIHINAKAWVCADVHISPGVTVGEGAVIGARSTVTQSIPPWKVAAGYPARVILDREITTINNP